MLHNTAAMVESEMLKWDSPQEGYCIVKCVKEQGLLGKADKADQAVNKILELFLA